MLFLDERKPDARAKVKKSVLEKPKVKEDDKRLTTMGSNKNRDNMEHAVQASLNL